MKILDQLDALNLDVAAKTQVAALVQALLDQVKKEAMKYETDIHAKDLKIQALILELAHLRRLRYGIKNEALSSLQRDLFEETCTEDIAALMAEVEQAEAQAGTPVTQPKRPRAGRQPLPPHLPRIEHRHEPESCQCGRCGKDLVKIGEDITEQLDVEPAKFFVHRHIRPQYACRSCETITAAPIPPALIDGGMAAVGLLTWVVGAD
jgi:transposase